MIVKSVKNPLMSLMFCLIMCFVSSHAFAQWVSAEGRYHFEGKITKSECNHQALLAAKKHALSQINLENLQAVELEACTETEDKTNCTYYAQTFSYLDGGYISSIKNKKMRREGVNTALEECVVTLDAKVHQYEGKPDPNFYLAAEISGNIRKRSGENFVIQGRTSEKAFIYIFYWSPSENKDVYNRLMPNDFDKEVISNSSFQVPSKDHNMINYSFLASFPNEIDKQILDEYFFVLATKKPFKTDIQETKESFHSRLNELGRGNWRLLPVAYYIVKEGK